MKIRMHKGGFTESIETLKIIEPTTAAIKEYMGVDEIQIKTVYPIFDDREPWNSDTYVVRGFKMNELFDIALISQLPNEN